METRWSLKLEDRAAAAAKRIKREVRELNAAMRELGELAGLSDKAMRTMGGGDTSRRLRAQTGLIREQTRALREQRAMQAQRVRDDRAAGRQRERETRQQLAAHQAVARSTAQRAAVARRHEAEARRAEARAMGGRTRLDVAAPSRMGGRTRMDVAAGAGGRTRMDLADLSGRTRAEGASPQDVARGLAFQQRARDLQARHRARVAADERRASQASARVNERQQRNNQNYFQRLSRLRQASFRENDQLRRRDAAQHARAVTQGRRTEERWRRSADRGGREGLSQMLGMGGRGASALYGGVTSIVSATLSAVAAIAGLAVGFAGLSVMIGGAILQMVAFRESTIMTLSTLMRVPGEESMTPAQRRNAREIAATGELGWAQQFGRETPLSTQQVVELRTQASTAGYQGAEARTMTAAAADAGALHPNDASTGSRFLLQMGQLRNSSRARSADYRPAAMAAGVSETAAMRRAAIAAGVVQRQGERDPAYQRRIEDAQGRGQITGRQMHDAILAEQNAQLGNRRSGDFARSQSGSMAAVLSNLGEGAEAFVTSIANIERLPGVLALKALLTDIADTLGGATRNGKTLQAAFAGGLNRVAGFVGTIFGKRGFDGALTSAMETAKELWPIVTGMLGASREGFMEGFGPFITELRSGAGEFMASGGHDLIQWAREFGRGLGLISVFMLRVTGAVITLSAQAVAGVGPLYDMLASLQGIVEQLREARAVGNRIADPFGAARAAAWESILDFFGIGERMGDGVAAGFRSRQGAMQAEISSVMASLPATARADMQIKSPSRVMADLVGEPLGDGVTMGLRNSADGVQAAMSSLVAPPGLPGFGGGALGGFGGAPISIGPFTIQIDGAQDASGVVDELQARVESIFAGMFERAQLAGVG
ncbi:MAG: hypothetical protein Q8S73_42960 [Deltaproteobacteria bacterium]|nr:hypothetical protein [Myxococcales bacterium]MDP3220923.1 hypothetical protein [Deltaproteobacteria bacterium]